MTTQKKSSRTKTTTKKSTSKAKVEFKVESVALDHRDKTAFMVVMLRRPEGATLKEMADALGWKENSIRGAMSAYAKKTGRTIASEKKLTSGLTTSKPTLKLPSNRKGAEYRPLFFYLKIKMTNIFNQIYLIDFQNISSKFGLLWKFISQLLA